MQLYTLHKKIWKECHANESVPNGRDFLFTFTESGNCLSRSIHQPSIPLPTDTTWHFRCRFSPIRRRERQEFRVSPSEYPIWLDRLLQRHGMHLLNIGWVRWKSYPLGKNGQHFTIAFTDFWAHIQDSTLAEHAYRYGIGRRKAFGCGMLIAL